MDDVAAAADELRAKGYRLLVGPKEEPWGQTVARRRTLEVMSSSDAFLLLGVMLLIGAAILWWTQLRKP